MFWSYQYKVNEETGYWEEYQLCFQEMNDRTIMYELEKFELGIKNTFDRYLNCAPLNARDLKSLINQNLSQKGRIIIRKYKNNGNETLHKRTYKQTKFQEHFRIKRGVERCA